METNSDKNKLVFESRQASWIIAGLLFLGVIIFISGYMIGKKRAMQEFAHTVVNDSFVDQAQHSLYSMYGQSLSSEEEKPEPPVVDAITSLMSDEGLEKEEPEAVEVAPAPKPVVSDMVYYAKLIGFGSKLYAESFIKRVTSLGIPAILETRVSKNKKGKTITWFQVVTQKYDSKQELERIVSIVKRAENLKDIQILSNKQ